jgi:Tol biopolymer transport system component
VLSTTGLAGPAAAAPRALVLASTSDAGVKGNDHSFEPVLSADGGTVVFTSQASNLDPADTDPPPEADVYAKDLATGNITLVSATRTGVAGNGASFSAVVSADGSRVLFLSYASNLHPADTNQEGDAYVKDLTTGVLTLATASDAGVPANRGQSYAATLSADGSTVAFISAATNLDPADRDDRLDVYVKNLATGDVALVSTSATGVKSNKSCDDFTLGLSADGDTVAFRCRADNLHPDDTDGKYDVYVKDVPSGELTLASTTGSGVKGNDHSGSPLLSADGRTVAFETSARNFDPRDRDDDTDIYVKDLVTGELTLASTSDDGVKANDFSFLSGLSADGQVVAFYSSASNLDPARTDVAPFAYYAYVKDLPSGDLTIPDRSAAGEAGNGESSQPSLSADGATVAFESEATNLDPADSDALDDIYVATLAAPVSVSVGDRDIGEVDARPRFAVFPVRLSAPAAAAVSVNFHTVDGTARAGADYVAKQGTLTFRAGQTRTVVVIKVLADDLPEPTETFGVLLSNPSGITAGDGLGIGRIVDDD